MGICRMAARNAGVALLAVVAVSLAVSLVAGAAGTVAFKDDFSTATLEGRRALRGAWEFADHAASCVQDDELYKQYKNHGPIIFYDHPFTDGTVAFAFQARGAKAVVFTANGEGGHVFRVSWGDRGMAARVFTPEADTNSVVVGSDETPLPEGEWIPVEVALEGDRATLKVGDGPAQTFTHPALARPKTNVSVGFAFGTVSFRDLRIEP
jgi:hypothetical protein